MKNTAAILLAAGKGTRMKSDLPKVAHKVCGLPLICHSIRQLRSLRIKKIVVVVGYGKEHVIDCVKDYDVEIVEQKQQRGTGHALSVCASKFKSFTGNILVLPGDVFIEDSAALKKFCTYHTKKKNALSLLTSFVDEPKGYGRIIRSGKDAVIAIREELDASRTEKIISEINTGIYLFRGKAVFSSLKKIKKNSKKKEYYLTDIVDIYNTQKKSVGGWSVPDDCAILGVNDRSQLADIHAILMEQILLKHQLSGVTILEPASTYIECDVKIASDTIIYPYSYIEKNVRIGKASQIGPFCKIRSGSKIKAKSIIGSFVEIVRSSVGNKTNIKHLSYIGDAVIGDNVNIGAGTITANFDGSQKQMTRIKKGAFIGANSVLIAPVTIGEKAKTGASSVILKKRNVPRGKVACGIPARIVK